MDLFADQAGRALVVVAHPDDETLWAGGTILLHPAWRWRIVTLCRAGDPDRAPRFHRLLDRLGASGAMADLDDGAEQRPLSSAEVERTVLDLAAEYECDLLLTHGPCGEYTRHLRHVEVSAAVTALWQAGALQARALLQFAYEDGGGAYLSRPAADADVQAALPPAVWEEKRRIIEELYGFRRESWEWRVAPAVEAFHRISSPVEVGESLPRLGADGEGIAAV